MPRETTVDIITSPIPGVANAFVTADAATLLGISLTNRLGAWPASRYDVGGANPTNGAAWQDHDLDTKDGVTTLAVPPGGISDNDGGNDDPPFNYGAVSEVCPRPPVPDNNPMYQYPPSAEGLIHRFYTASRVISHLEGMLMSCDRITGAVEGPDNGGTRMHLDARLAGCVDDSTMTSPSTVCSDAVVDLLDGQAQTQTVNSSSFVMERVIGAEPNCDQVRAHNYDP
jgi:hypothetical protein